MARLRFEITMSLDVTLGSAWAGARGAWLPDRDVLESVAIEVAACDVPECEGSPVA